MVFAVGVIRMGVQLSELRAQFKGVRRGRSQLKTAANFGFVRRFAADVRRLRSLVSNERDPTECRRRANVCRVREGGFALVLGVAFALVASGARAEDGTSPGFEWGLAVGVLAAVPVGSGITQPGAPEAEFQSAFALQVEAPVVDIGRRFEIVPFGRVSLAGGPNRDLYEQALRPERFTGSVSARELMLGGGLRYHLLDVLDELRVFFGVYGAYSQSFAHYAIPADEGTVASPFARQVREERRHSGPALLLGVGLRYDIPLGDEARWGALPIRAEVQYAVHFLNRLSVDDPSDFREPGWLAEQGITRHQVVFVMSVGYQVR